MMYFVSYLLKEDNFIVLIHKYSISSPCLHDPAFCLQPCSLTLLVVWWRISGAI